MMNSFVKAAFAGALTAGMAAAALVHAGPAEKPKYTAEKCYGVAKAGKNKVTFFLSKDIASFSTWVEQLIAESTGKEGVGVLPVESEPIQDPSSYGDDRVFVWSQPNRGALAYWATGLEAAYLEGAFARARPVAVA